MNIIVITIDKGDKMSAVVIKLKQTSLAVCLIILMILWQGYGLYQGRNKGVPMSTYFYTKVISNVIPGTMIQDDSSQTNIVGKILYALTEINLTDYRTFIEKNIPLIGQQAALENDESYNTLIGFSKNKTKQEKLDDYFDQKDELKITQFEIPIDLGKAVTLEQLKDDKYVTTRLINFDSNLNYENQAMKQINTLKLVEKQFKINTGTGGPKVLIFHTHPHERFADEEPSGGGVMDVGEHLKEILETQYGIETLHSTTRVKKTPENAAKDDYGRMQIEISKILEENPSIEVAIDVHRDGGTGTEKFLTTVNGKPTAKLMLVNGFRQIQKQGKLTPLKNLPNPYVEDNMALALQIQLKAIEKYPGFYRKTLVKPYRYNLHMRPMSLLLEIGNENNIKEEALNTIEVFAELLMEVIEKD